MLQLLSNNIAILLPIILLSVTAGAIIIDRSILFYKIRKEKEDICDQAFHLMEEGLAWKADSVLEGSITPEAVVLQKGIQSRNVGMTEIRLRMESTAVSQMNKLEKNVIYLSTIGNATTLLGLFGTVTGMIRSFSAMQASGVSDPYVLAGGISQALITTAFGLGAAIPCIFFYNFFINLINHHAQRIQILTADILAFLEKRKLFFSSEDA
ncbi:MAG: MotA/TolQ/ExbB proton channel family protein [Spirochaetia bacterium]